jgi:hypothetical protein
MTLCTLQGRFQTTWSTHPQQGPSTGCAADSTNTILSPSRMNVAHSISQPCSRATHPIASSPLIATTQQAPALQQGASTEGAVPHSITLPRPALVMEYSHTTSVSPDGGLAAWQPGMAIRHMPLTMPASCTRCTAPCGSCAWRPCSTPAWVGWRQALAPAGPAAPGAHAPCSHRSLPAAMPQWARKPHHTTPHHTTPHHTTPLTHCTAASTTHAAHTLPMQH